MIKNTLVEMISTSKPRFRLVYTEIPAILWATVNQVSSKSGEIQAFVGLLLSGLLKGKTITHDTMT